MITFIRSSRPFVILMLGVFVNACFVPSVMAETASEGPLEVRTKFLKGMQYSLHGREHKPVFGFGGMSLKPDFKETIATNPEALKLASAATSYNTIAFLGQAGMLYFSLTDLIDAFGDVNDVNSGNLGAVNDGNSLMPFIVTAGVALVFGLMGKSKLKAGVRAYNAGAVDAAPEPDTGEPLPVPAVSGARIEGSTLVEFNLMSW